MANFVESMLMLIMNPYFLVIIPVIAVLLFYYIAATGRRFYNRVEFHTKAGTIEEYKCTVQGGIITFNPYKGKNTHPIVLHIRAKPKLRHRGSQTYKTYIVVEGHSGTINPPLPLDPEIVEGMIDGEAVKLEITNVEMPEAMGTEDELENEAIGYGTAFIRTLTEHMPKSKGDWLMIVVYILLGFAMGVPWGLLVGKGVIFGPPTTPTANPTGQSSTPVINLLVMVIQYIL